ncbi:MAG TPA: hypothetical protein P5026_10025, partial [Kiritimatiellia bacterium]|nr:hypothetical protein [Kiritimatiellia bacterium]
RSATTRTRWRRPTRPSRITRGKALTRHLTISLKPCGFPHGFLGFNSERGTGTRMRLSVPVFSGHDSRQLRFGEKKSRINMIGLKQLHFFVFCS